MPDTDLNLLYQEVEELTTLLRTDPDWNDLRSAIAKKGFLPSDVLLAGFMEDEEENEFGVIVTREERMYEFQRDTSAAKEGLLLAWRQVENLDQILNTFPAVGVALQMVRNGTNPEMAQNSVKK